VKARIREKENMRAKERTRMMGARLLAQSLLKKISLKRTWARKMTCSPDPM
jgi:hypothetical protein